VIDVQETFSQTVIRNLIKEYKSGRTPNPCTLCNRVIKWGRFLEGINALGIEKMATGHYIRLRFEKELYHLYRSGDKQKDQSYMLWQLSQQQLDKTEFPLAELTKTDARRIILENDIPVSIHKESQEICFIKDHYKEFLRDKIDLVPGDIVLTSGEIIGQHCGLHLYTIGQRKGLQTMMNVVLFVKELDIRNNRLVVTTKLEELERTEFEINQVNWIAEIPEAEEELEVQIRYNSSSQAVEKLIYREDSLQVRLKKPVLAITPGQSAVFYRGDELLGGGIILR